MDKRNILIQLDSDPQPSVFDRVVAVDSGADEVFSYGNVTPNQVRDLVHGCIFTRGPKDLHRTAIFIGGTNVAKGEALLQEAKRHMLPDFGLRVSILLDANGANTTAAAAVRIAAKHLKLKGETALVLGGTGPVGQRVARLLARLDVEVWVGSREQTRAATVCDAIRKHVPKAKLNPVATSSQIELAEELPDQTLVVSAGAAGVCLMPRSVWASCNSLKLAIDLNAVPPLGIEGVAVTDKAKDHGGILCYGAIGVGDTKMKIHKAAVASLFESNEHVLDAEEVYALAEAL